MSKIIHQHKRLRTSAKKDPFPHPKSSMRLLDALVVWLGIGNIIATIPQVVQIYSTQDASGVSAISWGYYTLFYAVLAVYGFVHREKPLIITYLGGVVLFAVIFVGTLIYS